VAKKQVRGGEASSQKTQFYYTTDMCKLLGKKQVTIRRWSDSGRIPAGKIIAGRWTWSAPQVDAWMEAQARAIRLLMYPGELPPE
jgi:predicted site-specific integrase-resolvase